MAELQQPGTFDHHDVKEKLEQWISELIENNKQVELADDFFVKANIRITKKERNRPQNRLLTSEQNTSQENFTDKTTKFYFRSSFEETTSVSLATSQGFTANVSGGMSGGPVVPSLGLSSSLEYSKSKSFGQDKSRAQNKELTAEVEVQPNTVVIVKELTYEVEWAAFCELELILRKEDKIEYKCIHIRSKDEFKSTEVKKLLQRLIAKEKNPQRLKEKNPHDHPRSSTQSNPMPASPKSNTFPRTRSQLRSVAVRPLNPVEETKSSPAPHSPKSNTFLKLESSTNEQTGFSPTPSSPASRTPKARSIHIQLPMVEISDHETTGDDVTVDASICLSSPDYNKSVPVDHSREHEHVPANTEAESEAESDMARSQAHVNFRMRLLTENVLVIEFKSDCLFSAEEHNLEIIKLPSDPDRAKRIIDHQTSVYQNDKEDMQLSLKADKY